MLAIKKGVDLAGIRPEILVGLQAAETVYRKYGYECVVTSALDGEHGENSLHYKGQALDLRIRHLHPGDMAKYIQKQLADKLGRDFDVVLERTHIHMEYDPK